MDHARMLIPHQPLCKHREGEAEEQSGWGGVRQGDEGWSGIHWPVGESGEGLRKIIGEMIDRVYRILWLKNLK